MARNPLGAVAAFFDFEGHQTNFQREVVAGLTTFVTMSYIIAVNPAILKEAGIPPGPSMVATILAAVVGTLIMGLYANRPFAIAPYMGENAFIAFTVVKVMGYSWQTALAAVFISGVLFVALTVARIRQWLLESVPAGLRYSFAAGIGLFLVFIGMNEAGIVALGVPGAPVRIGAINSPQVLAAIGCFLLISVLMLWQVPGAILLGILTTAAASFVLGLAPAPARWVSAPPDLRPLLFQIDLRHALSFGFFGVLLTVFVMAFIDTLGLPDWIVRARGLSGRGWASAPDRTPDAGRRDRDHRGRPDRHHHFRCLHRVGNRYRRRRTHRIHRGGHRDPVRGGAVLRPLHHRDSGGRLQPSPDRRRTAHAGADLADRFQRLHGDDPGASR